MELDESPSLCPLLPGIYRGAWKLAAMAFARDVNEAANTRRVCARLGLSQATPRDDLEREPLDPDRFPAAPYERPDEGEADR